MGIEKIDKNFATKRVKPEDYEWFDHTHQNVTLHGLFYDYEDKYQSGSSYSVIPAEIPQEALTKIQAYALKAFAAIDGTGLSRVDFFYKKDGTILLNEINTLPGFTDISMYSKLWKNCGLSYSALLDRLIDLAFQRKEEHERCCHE